jgi:uncharacterized protein
MGFISVDSKATRKSATVAIQGTLTPGEKTHLFSILAGKIDYFCYMTKREKIIGKILELSEKKYPDAEIYLYGSQARGDAKKFSDWDLLILLNSENVPFSLETEIMDEFYNIELETGQIMSPIIYPKKEWNTKYKITPLFENINKEGIRLK